MGLDERGSYKGEKEKGVLALSSILKRFPLERWFPGVRSRRHAAGISIGDKAGRKSQTSRSPTLGGRHGRSGTQVRLRDLRQPRIARSERGVRDGIEVGFEHIIPPSITAASPMPDACIVPYVARARSCLAHPEQPTERRASRDSRLGTGPEPRRPATWDPAPDCLHAVYMCCGSSWNGSAPPSKSLIVWFIWSG